MARINKAAPESTADDLDAFDLLARDLLRAHNERRAEANLPPLELDPLLCQAADRHARAMAEARKMSHEGPDDGSSSADRIRQVGYRYQSVAENVAAGQQTVDEVMDDWMDSPGHRRNILGPYRQIGIGRARGGDGRAYWCVNFGTPWPEIDADDDPRRVLERLNRAREAAGLPPLSADPDLNRLASRQAQTLGTAPDLATADPDAVFNELQASGLPYRQAALSLGAGLTDPAALIEDLTGRSDQRKTLLGPFDRLGVGESRRDDGTPIWVLLFIRSR